MNKLLIGIFVIMIMCIGYASALSTHWHILSDKYIGSAIFYDNNKGSISVEGYPTVGFTWDRTDDNIENNHYYAKLDFPYNLGMPNIPFTYSPDENAITTPLYNGAKLVGD
jgi:hypothetical protein